MSTRQNTHWDMANPAVSRSPAPKIRFQKIWRDQGRVEISKIMKITISGTWRATFGGEIGVFVVLPQCFKEKDMACRDGIL